MALSDMKTAAVAWYPLDEASGNAIDGIGAVDLTERATVGVGTGKFYGNARDFESGDGDGFTVADEATLSVADIDFFIVAWVNPESFTSTRWIIAKGDTGTTANLPYSVDIQTSGKPRIIVGNGAGSSTIYTWTGTALSTGAWGLVIMYHDAANNLIGVSVNGAAFETAACSHGSFNDTAHCVLGDLTTGALLPFDGLMQDVVLGKNYIPTDSDAAALWDSGTGVAFDDWDAGGGATVPAGSLALLGVGI